MALTTPTICECELKMKVQPSVVNLIKDIIPIHLHVFFNSIASMEVLSGGYTPSNNTLSLASGLSSNVNFIILITDSQANLTLKSGGTTLLLQNPVMKLYFNPMVVNTTYNITDIILDGTTAALVPMSQVNPVNYTLIYGTGIIN